ncbi:FAD binding domain-containing protein [Paenibacillus tarimensis]
MAVENESVYPVRAVWQPDKLAEAWRLMQAFAGETRYAAGGTFLQVQWEAGAAEKPAALIDLHRIPGMKGIEVSEGGLVIGALTPLSACRLSPDIVERLPVVAEAVRQIAAPSIRNLATIGGNVVTGIGDSIPALLISNAELLWYNGKRLQSEPLAVWLSRPRSKDGAERRILKEIRIPPRSETYSAGTGEGKWIHVYHKVGRRESFTPSLVTVAVTGHLDPNGRLSGFRLAAGGGGTMPRRLTEAEDLLADAVYNPSLLSGVYEAVIRQYDEIDERWASAEYLKRTAANLIVSELWKAMTLWGKGEDSHAAEP